MPFLEVDEILVSRDKDTSELQEIRKNVFVTEVPNTGKFWAIIGPHHAGKSTIRDMWIEVWKATERDKVYCTSVSSAAYGTSLAIWKLFADDLEDRLEDRYKKITTCINKIQAASKNTDEDDVLNMVLKLFKTCKNEGVHVILVIDEANNIASMERENKRNFFHILKALQDQRKSCGISILMLSQVGMQDIVSGEADLSTFIHSYPQVRIMGFDYTELDEFFDKVRAQGQSLGMHTIGRMLYYCGRFPGLLGSMCKATFEDSVIGINERYRVAKSLFDEIYNWFYERLEKEMFMTAEGKVSGLDVFMQSFVGPDFYTEIELSEWLEILYKKGLIEQSLEGHNHIYDEIAVYMEDVDEAQGYKGVYQDTFAKKVKYEPVSPDFIEYVKERRYKEEYEEIQELRIMVRNVERSIRKLIYNYYLQLDEMEYGVAKAKEEKKEQWERINENILYALMHGNDGEGRKNDRKKNYWEGDKGLKGKVERSGRYEYSSVDVLAFFNYYQLIIWKDNREENPQAKCWEAIKGFLSCYHQMEDNTFLEDFDFLTNVRNDFAHGNEVVEFSDVEKRKKLRDICTKILKSIHREETRIEEKKV